MIETLRHRPSPAMVVAFIALLVALGGVAFATIPDSSGEIHGCFKKANGDLRLVDSATDCRNSEKAIAWSQQGPQGDPGPPGGSAVVARARGTASQTATNSFAAYPLIDHRWTQQADETVLILGEVAYTPPADCGSGIHALLVEIQLDGQTVTSTFALPSQPGPAQTGLASAFEPGASRNRTITARIRDDCTTGQHFTVTAIKVNVIGFH